MGKIRISCSQLSSVSWTHLDLTYFLCLYMSHTLPTTQTRLPAGKSKGYLTNRRYSCPRSCFPRLWIQFSVQKPCPAEKEIRFSCLPGIRLRVFYPSQGPCLQITGAGHAQGKGTHAHIPPGNPGERDGVLPSTLSKGPGFSTPPEPDK